jgi:hypothetical protein
LKKLNDGMRGEVWKRARRSAVTPIKIAAREVDAVWPRRAAPARMRAGGVQP